MSKKLFSQLAVALSGAAVIAAGTTLPAIADPASVAKYGELVGFGSDTTMDVMDGISKELGLVVPTDPKSKLKLASYKAIGSMDVAVDASGVPLPRFNGSGNGKDSLLISIGQLGSKALGIAPDEFGAARPNVTVTTEELAGKLHFGRSSSAPSGAVANGTITFIPFAVDALTYATSPDSKIPSDIPLDVKLPPVAPATVGVSDSEALSLTNIYKGIFTQVIVDEATQDFISIEKPDYELKAGEEAHTINAYIPQAGSGTRSFWIGQVGISEANITAGATAAKDKTETGLSVQEHDGAAVANDPYALVGFSISQWVAQTNKVAPSRLYGAVLRSIGEVSPTVGSGTSFATNPEWTAIKRSVYNMVPTDLVNATTENAITRAFRGTESLVCKAKDVIQKYGYGLLSYPSDAAAIAGTTVNGNATVCGNITAPNRVGAPSTSTVALAAPVKSKAGNSAVIKATVTSNGNQGGTVTLYSDFEGANEKVVASGVVAKGATTVDITVTNTTSSAYAADLKAEFIPTLSGIAASNSGATALALSLVAAPVKPSVTTAATVAGTAKVARTLTAGKGSWKGTATIAYTYKWYRCTVASTKTATTAPTSSAKCATISGATKSTYKLTSADAGKYVRVLISAKNSVGTSYSLSKTSAKVAK